MNLRGGAVLVALILSAAGCRSSSSEAGGTPESLPEGTLAQVNGAAITAADVGMVTSARGGHGEAPGAQRGQEDVVETLIDQELAAQRAVELGLDDDPAYRDELARLTAQVNTLRRQRLSTAFHRHITSDVQISEADARAYYEANAATIGTEVRVLQVLTRDQGAAEAIQARLAGGTPFAEVGSDLGWLRWHQLPDAWREPLAALAPGATTGVIAGPNRRFWILQLAERRQAAGVSFDSERAPLMERLAQKRTVELREEAVRKLRADARIVRRPANESLRVVTP